ncbi:MAG: hypothetical protein AAGI37_00240 [Planctomycetota bacterium]
MNALTKAFVVVVTILSVVLVALVVPFAARVPDYASQYEQMKQDRDTQLALAQEAATKVRNDIAAAGSELEDALESISALTAELDRANNDKKALETELTQARITVDRSAAGLEIATRTSETQGNQINEQAEQINQYISQVGVLQNQNADLSQVLIDERSKVRRLSDNYMRIQEENKALEQRLLETTALLETALGKLAVFEENAEEAVAEGAVVLPPAGVIIRGSVTKIDQVTDNLTFVEINVGTRDLVKEGMEFLVYRGDEFVAKVQIASVDTAASVGQLTTGGGIQDGDLVLAGKR